MCEGRRAPLAFETLVGPCRVELQGEAPRLQELTGVSCCGCKLPTRETPRAGPQGKGKLTSLGGWGANRVCLEQGQFGGGDLEWVRISWQRHLVLTSGPEKVRRAGGAQACPTSTPPPPPGPAGKGQGGGRMAQGSSIQGTSGRQG